MQNTTNYNLNKPDGNDFVRIESLNENADIVDGKLKELEDGLNNIDFSSIESQIMAHTENQQIHVTQANKNSWDGKVNRTGDTMTGDLIIKKSIPAVKLQTPNNTKNAEIRLNANDTTHYGLEFLKDGQIFMKIENQKVVSFVGHDDAWFSVQDLKYLPTPTNAVLSAGWENADVSNPLRFYKNSFGIVHVYGRIKITSTSAPYNFTTLPVGYRPLKQVDSVGLAGVSEATSIEVRSDGLVGTILTKTVDNTVLVDISYPTTI